MLFTERPRVNSDILKCVNNAQRWSTGFQRFQPVTNRGSSQGLFAQSILITG